MSRREEALERARHLAQMHGGEVEDYLKEGATIEEIAAALGGTVVGPTTVTMPSPGREAGDRSMTVHFYRSGYFFVYGCEGPPAMARASINARLKLADLPVAPAEDRTAEALAIWDEALPAAGTPVETYLKSRAISVPVPERIRFHPRLWHGPSRMTRPAMVALVTDVADRKAAIHRTWLSWTGRSKAEVEPNKMSLGPIRAGAIRLCPAGEDLVVGEGIETSMSAMVAGRAAWSALSAMGIRSLVLPESVRGVTILVDGDDNGESERAAGDAGGRWLREGRRVLLCRAPPGMDLNDVLMRKEP